jgi:hypothetical protein
MCPVATGACAKLGTMNRDGREDAADWFEHSSLKRVLPQRLHGVTPEWLVGELTRLPGDPSRQTATR